MSEPGTARDYRATVVRDGVETDITEALARVYDLVVSSMDFGSGFWDAEDVAHIRAVQVACGFKPKPYELDECQTCGHYRRDHLSNGGKCYRGWGFSAVPNDPDACMCTSFRAPWAVAALAEEAAPDA